eukprot:TRINITY_DN67722_c1_g12_i1.p3 TRINITY_DN67722_c1_g12~~TRINITY_DN67722_c1_g12_i1.p3  ORF type:complete len:100 (-),score=17.65 TRINITY_DN67722_c1_g12_i1:180-479(-)
MAVPPLMAQTVVGGPAGTVTGYGGGYAAVPGPYGGVPLQQTAYPGTFVGPYSPVVGFEAVPQAPIIQPNVVTVRGAPMVTVPHQPPAVISKHRQNYYKR